MSVFWLRMVRLLSINRSPQESVLIWLLASDVRDVGCKWLDNTKSLMRLTAHCRRTLKPILHLARHVSTLLDSTRSTCRAHAFCLCRANSRTARLDTLDTRSSTRSTRNLVCCVICIKIWYVNYSLIYWSIHLFNLSFDERNRTCVCKSIKRLNVFRRAL